MCYYYVASLENQNIKILRVLDNCIIIIVFLCIAMRYNQHIITIDFDILNYIVSDIRLNYSIEVYYLLLSMAGVLF